MRASSVGRSSTTARHDLRVSRRASSGQPDPRPCPFCQIAAGALAAEVVYSDDLVIAFLDHRPLFRGHVLLAPRAHLRLLSDLPTDEVGPFFRTAQRLERAVEDGLATDGSMVLINNVVSQSVPHLHLHVIPRRRGDGLRFWLGPRQRYTAEDPADEYARRIRAALD
jgi:histidine triad (HIT) family protein